MITSYKSILDFLRIDFPLVFKNSLLLGIVYLFLIPVIRGTSNLDAIHSADVFGQSLVLTGAILLIPITKWELETSVKEIVCTKAWSYIKSVSIRLICGFLLITVMIVTFAFIMQFKNCVFPFWEYVSIFKICNRDNSVCCFSGDFRTLLFTVCGQCDCRVSGSFRLLVSLSISDNL